ncbi:MAG: YciI family protein [Pseudomonadota bacterium]
MLYAIICIDKPGHLEVRKANREAHIAHIKGSNGAIVQAGPFLDAAGEMCGSLLIYEAEDIAEAQAWADADPYKAADLFQSVEIRPWHRVVG